MIIGVSWIKNATNLKRHEINSFSFKPDRYTIQTFLDLFSSKYYSSDIYNVLVSSIDEICSAKTFFNIFAVGIVIKEKNTKCVWKNW